MEKRHIAIAGAWFALVSCSLFVDTSGLEGDGAVDASTAGDSSVSDAVSDIATNGDSTSSDGGRICPSGTGAKMVLVPGNATTPSFCIDSTEATSADYSLFLETGPSLASLPPECSFKSEFSSISSIGEIPANVDWCDAVGYCKYAGKRLCGKIGGGSNDFLAFADLTKSQWFYACTGDGQTSYPYGNAYNGALCNDIDWGEGGPIAAASDPKCVGGFPGIYDMAGNMWEWEDSCTPGDSGSPAGDSCRVRGGTWVDGQDVTACGYDYLQHFAPTRSNPDGYMGIRCCAD
jgi:formylglycine-generating enzyme